MDAATSFLTSTAESVLDATVFTVKEIARNWKLSVDTVQKLFKDEPDVWVQQSGRKRMLRIPTYVKERVWRRMSNKRVV
jgi:hypothetical protein